MNEELIMKNYKKGFTLAEILIGLLVLSIIMVAFAPVITTRMDNINDPSASPFKYSANGSDAYFGLGTQTVLLGQNERYSSDLTNRFTIRTTGDEQAHILLKQNDDTTEGLVLGQLSAYSNDLLSLGDVELYSGTSGDESVGVGLGVIVNEKSLAVGNYSQATGLASTAVGAGSLVTSSVSTIASGMYSTALGYDAQALQQAGTALGYSASAEAQNAVSIGTESSAEGSNALAFGYNALATAENSIAMGTSAQASSSGAVAIGNSISCNSANTICLGDSTYTVEILGTLNAPNAGITSDKRLKDVGEEFVDGIDKLDAIQVYNFTYKNDKKKIPHVGVIAQDLQKIFPDAIIKGRNGYLSVRNEDMFYAMINSIKMLNGKVKMFLEELQTQANSIIELGNENAKLREDLTILEEKYNELEAQNTLILQRLNVIDPKASEAE